MKLPNGERTDLGTKIEDYVLNPMHWEGRHKARVFDSALGITLVNRKVLRFRLADMAILVRTANLNLVFIFLHGGSIPSVVERLNDRTLERAPVGLFLAIILFKTVHY